MSDRDFDVIVIGSGPAGEGASMKAAKEGRSVAVVERYKQVGGGCTHWGTIPSKALREAIRTTLEFKNHPIFRQYTNTNGKMSVTDMLKSAASVVQKQVGMRETFYNRNAVPILQGNARFIDAHTIEVQGANGITPYTAEHFIIATGSRPFRPADIDFKHPRIYDADTILGLDHTPRSITIYGAGVIGCEYASMFRMFGVKVNLINQRAKLLEFLDDEVIDALAYHLRDMGTIIRHNETYDRIEGLDDGVVVHLKSNKHLKTDCFLWANGRAPNTETLNLQAAGVDVDDRGRVKVNDVYQTSQPHIYAAGDVIGPPGLASASYDQGRFAATHMVEGHCDHHLVSDIPNGIYTTPEISSVGKTERQLTQEGVPYEVGQAFFKSIARAQITGNTVGVLKILFRIDTLEILGIHCFGANASEIIHIGQAIMHQPVPYNSLNYFINTTFNYPTMAEAYRVAALNGLNRAQGT